MGKGKKQKNGKGSHPPKNKASNNQNLASSKVVKSITETVLS